MRPLVKILRPILLLAVIAVVMLWLIGGKTHTWTAEMDTSAEPDRIFRAITEPQRMGTWMSEVVRIHRSNELPPSVGTRDRIVTEDERGRRAVVESEIVEFDSKRLLKLRLNAPRYDATSTFIIEPKGQAYRLQQRLQSRYKGLHRLVTPWISSDVQSRLDSDLQRLKRLLEEPEEY